MKRLINLFIALAVLLGTTTSLGHSAYGYDVTWTKAKALDYAGDGLYERYVFGRGQFRNNNTWDSDEGLDCSGYVAKVVGRRPLHLSDDELPPVRDVPLLQRVPVRRVQGPHDRTAVERLGLPGVRRGAERPHGPVHLEEHERNLEGVRSEGQRVRRRSSAASRSRH